MSILLNGSNEVINGREDLLRYFATAERPKSTVLIGVEHEKFPFREKTLEPVAYDELAGLRDVMNGMEAFGWVPIMEGENIIGLTRDKAAITFEPGGQIELAGSPLTNLHETGSELHQHFEELYTTCQNLDIGFFGMGFHPTARREDIPWVPKGRYKIMRNYMPKVGSYGLDMMLRTTTVQVNLDFCSEADMVKKFRVGLALQPIATVLFAASPFLEKRPSGYNSTRMEMWEDTDKARCGAPNFIFEAGFGYEKYTDFALNVPMYFVYRNGHYIDCTGQSFRDFMAAKLAALPGEKPTITDWANHLTTIFTDVRLKRIIEMRGADSGTEPMLQALPAFWTGLLYDQVSLDAAWDIIKGWTAAERTQLRKDAKNTGLRAIFRGRPIQMLAAELVELSKQGLKRRARMDQDKDETIWLDPLHAILKIGKNRSDEMLDEANAKGFDARRVIEQQRLGKRPVAEESPPETVKPA